MKKNKSLYKRLPSRLAVILVGVSLLIACAPINSNNAPENPNLDFPQTPLPPLPGTFQTALLNPLDTPRTYIEETCRYLRSKWNPANARPGTVVMIILIKNINRGTAELPESISLVEFGTLMEQLKAQGYEAIDTRQFQAFMERNIEIPPRSVLLIQDGNQSAEYFDRNFRDYFDRWGWPIVNGWVSEPEISETLLRENITLEYEGFIDHQARGISPGTTLSDESGKTVIARELQGSLAGFAEQFGKTPTAIVWPNGGFGIRPVEAARQLRFKLGFTGNPRGPVMYNWVPLADLPDPDRPALIPEGPVNDPLMTLPTYSPNEAFAAIDLVRAIGKEAAAYAEASKAAEHKYYEIVCEETYGPMPTP